MFVPSNYSTCIEDLVADNIRTEKIFRLSLTLLKISNSP